MAQKLEAIKAQLNAKHYVMNDTWLKDCLGYYFEERNAVPATDAEIIYFVTEQWLLSDLREINNEKGSLPPNLQQQKSITLQGNYILQFEKGYDISTSKYKQLEKIRKVSNENIEATEVDKTQFAEPTGKRMLYLHLTDGIQNVTAMEYKSVPSLKSDRLIPGYKLLIKGPVKCRKGVLLLEEENISAMKVGGEIDSLLIPNAIENVLARALNLPENPDPYGDGHPQLDRNAEDLFDDTMDVDLEAETKIDRLNNTTPGNQLKSAETLDQTLSNLSINILDKNVQNQTPMTQRNRRDSALLNELPVCFEQAAEEVEFPADSDDEWIGMIDESNLDVVSQIRTDSNPTNHQDLVKYQSDKAKSKTVSTVEPQLVINEQSFEEFPTDFEVDDFEIDSLADDKKSHPDKNDNLLKKSLPETSGINASKVTTDKSTKPMSNQSKSKTALPITPQPVTNRQSFDDFPTEFPDFDVGTFAANERSHASKNNNLSKKRPFKAAQANTSKLTVNTPMKPTSNFPVFDKNDALVASTSKSDTPPKRNQSPLVGNTSRATSKLPKPNTGKTNKKITDFIVRGDAKQILSPKSLPIYNSIRDVLQVIPTKEVVNKTLRARVKTLHHLRKVESIWFLEAILMDATDTIDVIFSNECLERLIGYSVIEFIKVKKFEKTNPKIQNQLRMALRNAETKLINANGLFKLMICPNETKPKVLAVKPFPEEQKSQKILD